MNNHNNGKPAPSGYTVLDPRAAVWIDSPYALIAGLAPDSTGPQINRLTHDLQRQNNKAMLTLIRKTRNLTSRLIWDLQTLGTTPGVSVEAWRQTADLLHAGERAAVYQIWIDCLRQDETRRSAALHVCAVLSAADLAWAAENEAAVSGDTWRRFIAFWAALLAQRPWLRQFALYRCAAWARTPAPNDADQLEWLAASVARAEDLLRASLETSPKQQAAVWGLWHREQAAIEAAARAGGKQNRPTWTPGLGPLGLELLGEAAAAQGWLLQHSKSYRGGLPLAALKAGEATLDTVAEGRGGEAATALQCLHSSLGSGAAYIWHGQGQLAWSSLQALRDAPQAESVEDAWFGQPPGAGRRRLRALEELRIEALLLKLHVELSDLGDSQQDPVETSRHLLFLADSVRRPNLVVESLERQLIGRLAACTEGRQLPAAAELSRLLAVALSIREQLLARGMGKRCGSTISELLCARAVQRWNRSGHKMPPPKVQHAALRDMMLAAELAPQDEEMLCRLGEVALQMRVGSAAERQDRLRRVLSLVDGRRQTSAATPKLEELRLKLLYEVDPAAAKEAVNQAVQRARNT